MSSIFLSLVLYRDKLFFQEIHQIILATNIQADPSIIEAVEVLASAPLRKKKKDCLVLVFVLIFTTSEDFRD